MKVEDKEREEKSRKSKEKDWDKEREKKRQKHRRKGEVKEKREKGGGQADLSRNPSKRQDDKVCNIFSLILFIMLGMKGSTRKMAIMKATLQENLCFMTSRE